MKNSILIYLALLSILFVSCKKESIEESIEESKKTEVKSIICYVYYTVQDLYFTMLEPTIKYIDESGNEQSELMISQKWKKELKFTDFPANVSVRLFPKSKNQPLTEKEYDLYSTFVARYQIEYVDGTLSELKMITGVDICFGLRPKTFDWWVNLKKDTGYELFENKFTLIDNNCDVKSSVSEDDIPID